LVASFHDQRVDLLTTLIWQNPEYSMNHAQRIPFYLSLYLTVFSCQVIDAGQVEAQNAANFQKPIGDLSIVKTDVLEAVRAEASTPYKYGVVLKGDEGESIDCPSVFRFGGKWYMVFIAIRDKVGYETYLAESEDLLHWERLGKILSFASGGWDQWQSAGTIALQNFHWAEDLELEKFRGSYWMTFIGGALQGYETDPLSIGVARTEHPDQTIEWVRIDENPVLSPDQPDVRFFEKTTLYRSNVIRDSDETLGFPFVMFYNGKDAAGRGHERIGMAVSNDMLHWERYGDAHVIYNGAESQWSISGDPQVVKMGDLWVMFYFGAFWKPGAFDTFACSWDLVNWTKWEGAHLVESGESWDRQFAHKPWVLKHQGVVYHFYCAVGDEGRVIALATSRDLSTPTTISNAE